VHLPETSLEQESAPPRAVRWAPSGSGGLFIGQGGNEVDEPNAHGAQEIPKSR